LAELRPDVRERITCHEEDYAITRPRSRTPSKIVDSAAAELLKAFRSPKTITDAVIEYSGARNRDPEQILEAAVFPLLRELIESRFLIPRGGENAEGITASWTSGDRVAGFEIIERIQVVEDTEVYRVRLDASCVAALKITRPGVSPRVRRAFEREELILRGVEDR
jgi:eukaryotic-like serine/threonine-protein kinase